MAVNCVNNAPLFAYQIEGKTYGIVQGCCNNWNCPRCGQQRAREEYGRIIEGCKKLTEGGKPLYFITITCKGRDISVKDAENGYAKNTNKLLTAWRVQAKRTHQEWAYVQVTERQSRGHPHSHILTTFSPTDVYYGYKDNWITDNNGVRKLEKVPCFRSDYIERSAINASLGSQYDISTATTIEGVSRYVAKYLFKDSIFDTIWPKGWRRVRYSQSFPKLTEVITDAMVLIKRDDWLNLSRKAAIVAAKSDYALEECVSWLRGSDVVILRPKVEEVDKSSKPGLLL